MWVTEPLQVVEVVVVAALHVVALCAWPLASLTVDGPFASPAGSACGGLASLFPVGG